MKFATNRGGDDTVSGVGGSRTSPHRKPEPLQEDCS